MEKRKYTHYRPLTEEELKEFEKSPDYRPGKTPFIKEEVDWDDLTEEEKNIRLEWSK